VATGLAWTPMGGDIMFIESAATPSPEQRPSTLTITGQLGDVMRESAQAALSFVRADIDEIGARPDFYEKHDIHIHVPAGAIPKDGPSAGIAMTTALASLFSSRRVKPLLAMTGEVTLSGRVLPVGGIKEKVLGARRAGIRTVILPERNRKDVMEDLPEEVRKEIDFEFVNDVHQVLHLALEPKEGSARTRQDSAKGAPSDGRGSGKASRRGPAKRPLPLASRPAAASSG
ncbi:MAG TPA: S16 family serine protease, partial [Chthonomonadales bacterium]|nr:S16 family serine protease [Chthonomonadales bacterium]